MYALIFWENIMQSFEKEEMFYGKILFFSISLFSPLDPLCFSLHLH